MSSKHIICVRVTVAVPKGDFMTREEYNRNPNICKNCGKEILCPDNIVVSKVIKKQFCDRSCSTTYNNKQRIKKEYFCSECGELVGVGEKYSRRKYCDDCNPNSADWDNITLKEVKEKRQYQSHSRIRTLARKKFLKETNISSCQHCGYDKHIEVCHIKGINEFSEDALISEINSLDNMIGLCPNCHWEFDNLPR